MKPTVYQTINTFLY